MRHNDKYEMKFHRLRIKLTLTAVLLPLLLSSICAGSSKAVFAVEADSVSEHAGLTVPILFDKEIPEDTEEVFEAASTLILHDLGIEVHLIPIIYSRSSSQFDQRKVLELHYLQKQGIVFDLFPDVLEGGSYLPLNDLLEEYGKDIISLVDVKILSLLSEDGLLYKLPSASDYATSYGITMRRDIIEKHQIDLSSIQQFRDLDQLFCTVHALEPDLYLISGYTTGQSFIRLWKNSTISISPICAFAADDPGIMVNYYATEEYKELLTLIYDWNEAGFLIPHQSLQSVNASALVDAGQLFSYFSSAKPGAEYGESVNCGREMITLQLMGPEISQRGLDATPHWGINADCANPKEAMRFLNYLYTNEQLTNLLTYGIEGKHYTVLENGMFAFPETQSGQITSYKNTQPWLLPNQLLAGVPEKEDPQIREKIQEYHSAAVLQDTAGFSLDTSSISLQVLQLERILDTYENGLETGQLDPSYYLPKMLSEMKAAGDRQVIEEAQRQYDLWKSSEGTRDE